ncbi:MAG TPA: hypothetical protein VK956_16800 [Verrucomicrobium sp.]|nr:hypothetical protein [Verrucomicrobium sp.]
MSAVRNSQSKRRKLLKEQTEAKLRIKALQEAAGVGAGTGASRSAIIAVEHADDEVDLPSWRKRKFVIGLLLLPVCLLASLTFMELLFNATVDKAFWKSEGFWFFAFGCIFWLSLGWVNLQPAIAYVFAHEMTHAITARLSGGEVHQMHVDEAGGYVETDATNTIVTLSPYMVPFYTVVVFALYALFGLFIDMDRLSTIPLGAWSMQFKWIWIFYWLVGVTWCFHITFTLQVLRTEQSDLKLNGEFFSIMLIFLANIALLGALFVSASPNLGWTDVWADARSIVDGLWTTLKWFTGRDTPAV